MKLFLFLGILAFVLFGLAVLVIYGPLFVLRLEAAQPVHNVTFETFGDHLNENVILVGELSLPSSMVLCGDKCEFIYLEDPDDYTKTVNVFINEVESFELHGPNQMDSFPLSYTCEDLKVRTYDGTLAGCGDLVAITGRSCDSLYEHDYGWCIYRITKIEKIIE